MNQIFFEGDKVFHIGRGWGEVIEIRTSNWDHPVIVKFNKITASFTHCGRFWKSDANPSLSFTDYTKEPFSQERSHNFQVGQLVMVKGQRSWELRVFIEYCDNDNYPYKVSKEIGEVTSYTLAKDCRPLTEEEVLTLKKSNFMKKLEKGDLVFGFDDVFYPTGRCMVGYYAGQNSKAKHLVSSEKANQSISNNSAFNYVIKIA